MPMILASLLYIEKEATTMTIKNPYWNAIKRHAREKTLYETDQLQRWKFCNHYTWSVPDPETVAFVAQFLSPRAVEVGAGTGYWSWLMAQSGIDMLAYDIAPPNLVTNNKWHSPWDAEAGTFLKQLRETFYPVAPGGPDVLAQHTDRTLFLCWPPYRSPMAVRCLTKYPGSRLVYIGEDWGGNCATDTFFQKLEKEWSIVAFHDPVRWYRSPDSITVYERKVK
jgi:hypothetical protein